MWQHGSGPLCQPGVAAPAAAAGGRWLLGHLLPHRGTSGPYLDLHARAVLGSQCPLHDELPQPPVCAGCY